MSELVELVSSWEKIKEGNKNATGVDFCSFYLAKKKNNSSPSELIEGPAVSDSLIILSRLIRRVADIHRAYSKMALAEVDELDSEWFWFLNAVARQKEAKKNRYYQL